MCGAWSKQRHQQGELKVKLEQPNATVVKFIGQLRKCLTRRMKESGGTEHSVRVGSEWRLRSDG
jgi:hypothetical protein